MSHLQGHTWPFPFRGGHEVLDTCEEEPAGRTRLTTTANPIVAGQRSG